MEKIKVLIAVLKEEIANCDKLKACAKEMGTDKTYFAYIGKMNGLSVAVEVLEEMLTGNDVNDGEGVDQIKGKLEGLKKVFIDKEHYLNTEGDRMRDCGKRETSEIMYQNAITIKNVLVDIEDAFKNKEKCVFCESEIDVCVFCGSTEKVNRFTLVNNVKKMCRVCVSKL